MASNPVGLAVHAVAVLTTALTYADCTWATDLCKKYKADGCPCTVAVVNADRALYLSSLVSVGVLLVLMLLSYVHTGRRKKHHDEVMESDANDRNAFTFLMASVLLYSSFLLAHQADYRVMASFLMTVLIAVGLVGSVVQVLHVTTSRGGNCVHGCCAREADSAMAPPKTTSKTGMAGKATTSVQGRSHKYRGYSN